MTAPDELVVVISAAIAAHDPLDPWLVQSNYDEHYWDDEAAAAVSAVRSARTEAAVYEALASAVQPVVRDPDTDDYVRERLTASASAVWHYLESHR